MHPAARFHGIVILLTATTVFSLITWVKPFIDGVAVMNSSLLVLANLLSTLGIYTVLAKGLSLMLENLEPFRKFVFGRSYMHGTWVGYFIGHSGDKRLLVETLMQSLYDLRINGRSYDLEGELHATWKALATRIDEADGTMLYAYEMDIIKRDEPVRGITTIQLDYDAKTGRPHGLNGLAQDLADSARIPVHEEKWLDIIESYENGFLEAKRRYF